MTARLHVPHPLTLLLDEAQLRALLDECDAWEAEAYGPITTLLGVESARGVPGRWRGAFAMLGAKAASLLAHGPRRDGRYRLEVSANQAERFYAALSWRIATLSAAREPRAPVDTWRVLVTGLRAAAARPYGVQHELAPARPTPAAADPRQADLFSMEVAHG